MRRLIVPMIAVVMMAILPTVILSESEGSLWAQENSWNIDSAQFERNWPDSLIGRFRNTNEVLITPWGEKIFAVKGLTDDNTLGIWIQTAEGEWLHPRLPLPTGTSAYCSALILAENEDSSLVILTGTERGPYASIDSGRTWLPRNGYTINQLNAGEGTWWSDVQTLLDEGNGRWWAISGFDGPIFSPDYGETWELVNAGLEHRQEFVFGTYVIWLASDGKVWLQGEYAIHILDRHDNNRDSQTWQWMPITEGIEYNLVDGNRRCRAQLATFPNGKCDDGNGLMYLWSGWGYIFRSEDYGQSWEQMTEPEDEWPRIGNSTVLPVMRVNEAGLVFIGAENGGLFVSEDNGDNWLPVGGSEEVRQDRGEHYQWWHGDNDRPDFGLRVGGIFDLAFDSDGYLIIGTWDGALRSMIPMNGSLEEEEPNVAVPTPVLPENHQLLSVYPNPFNGTARIGIDVGENQPFDLLVYDVQGRLIKNLASGQGSRSIVWNASDLVAGRYFLKLQYRSQSANRKIAEQVIPVILAK